jgi:hypothetical protein
VEFAIFAQDRWHVGSRVTLELGMRMDRDQIVEKVNFSPRAGVGLSVLPEGRAILRGGYGNFVQRTPLNIGAFTSYESRTVVRLPADPSLALPLPITFRNVIDGVLRTPEANVGNVEWNQRFGRRFLLKAAFLRRQGSHEFIVSPTPDRGNCVCRVRVRRATGSSKRRRDIWGASGET